MNRFYFSRELKLVTTIGKQPVNAKEMSMSKLQMLLSALNNERYQRSENDTIELIKSKFSNECGIVDSHVKVSLTCQVFKLLYYFIACTI